MIDNHECPHSCTVISYIIALLKLTNGTHFFNLATRCSLNKCCPARLWHFVLKNLKFKTNMITEGGKEINLTKSAKSNAERQYFGVLILSHWSFI